MGAGPELEDQSSENIYGHVWIPLLDVPTLTLFPANVRVERITVVLQLLAE